MTRWTLAAANSLELVIKRSRFRCHAAPVRSGDEALAFLREVSDPGATHNCWALRCGDLYRSSDDGEPAGTAGRPILAAIDGQGLDGVIAVVTRWYGGIKLGAGGLVRAYGGCATECLRTATKAAVITKQNVKLSCSFTDLGEVHGLLGPHGVEKLDEHYDADGVLLSLRVPSDRIEALTYALREASRGRLQLSAASSSPESNA